ncbi:unnamed protein product [Effrenium voratum]|uniref:Uncharacterized protein n=1 Tax=Effrenium voratum TaxID=2562239 RepID=A0AA36I0Q9_9DINO|nr:unnamed protein product [Effrenium voratum]
MARLRASSRLLPGALGAALLAGLAASAFLQVGRSSASPGIGRREVLSLLAVAPALSKPDVASAAPLAGEYDDPDYPGCKRRILTLNNGEVQVNMKDPDRGRSCKGKQQVKFVLPGKSSGDQVTIDFSDRGGPSNVVAKFDGTNLVFSDGTSWTRKGDLPQFKKKGKGGVVGTRLNGVQFTESDD